MLVDDYIREEKRRLDAISDLKSRGSEREASLELESLQKWQRGILGFSLKDQITPGQLLKLFMAAKRGEL